jgi:hypothetical protein
MMIMGSTTISNAGKTADIASAKPVELRRDTESTNNTGLRTTERTTNAGSSNFGAKLRGFFLGEPGTSAIQTVGLIAGTTFLGAMTGLMTIGYLPAAIGGAILGAEFGWYVARHPKG